MTRMPAAERREQLLEVAGRLFAELGYHGATTVRLASEAEVTEPVLYQHFADKRDLYLVLVDARTTVVLEQWRETLEASGAPGERLRMLAEGPAGPAATFLVRALREPVPDPVIGKELRESASRLHEFIHREITGLQKQEAIRVDVSAADLAWTLLGLIVGSTTLADLGSASASRGSRGTLLARLLERD